jgi:hypothetical protein
VTCNGSARYRDPSAPASYPKAIVAVFAVQPESLVKPADTIKHLSAQEHRCERHQRSQHLLVVDLDYPPRAIRSAKPDCGAKDRAIGRRESPSVLSRRAVRCFYCRRHDSYVGIVGQDRLHGPEPFLAQCCIGIDQQEVSAGKIIGSAVHGRRETQVALRSHDPYPFRHRCGNRG